MNNNKNKLNILLSAYACEPYKGSEPSVGWNWALNLSKKHNVYVITRKNNKEIIEKFLKENKIYKNNLTFYYYDCSNKIVNLKNKIPYGIFVYYKLWQKGAKKLAESIINKEKIDIIHHVTFNEFRTPGYMSKLNKPFVWGPIGGGQYYNTIFNNYMSSGKVIFNEKVRNIINYAISKKYNIKKSINCSEVVLIADKSTEKILPKKFNGKYIRMLETAYYHNINFERSYNLNKNKRIRLLWVGNIIPRKGLPILIEALKTIDKNMYELVVIGDGAELEYCISKVDEYGLNDNIKFKGKIPYEKITKWYKQCDLFIFTSIRDTSGNVVLEAMEHGLPVIAFNHHGVADIVNNECGTLIDLNNNYEIIKDLRNSIMYYYNNRLEVQRKGNNARHRIKEKYTWDKKMEEIDKIYSLIMESK